MRKRHLVSLKGKRVAYPPMQGVTMARGTMAVALYEGEDTHGSIILTDKSQDKAISWFGRVVAENHSGFNLGDEVITLPMQGKILERWNYRGCKYPIVQMLGIEVDDSAGEAEVRKPGMETQIVMKVEEKGITLPKGKILGFVKYHNKTAGGLILPDRAKKFDSTCVVLAVGEGSEVKPGDRVMFSEKGVIEAHGDSFKQFYPELSEEEGRLIVVNESALWAVIE